ncbi:hypothetical protein M413DRAFT_30750 [Hebeloma cylindrosporum]|uniref:GST N-terminal domain-containing protein n=1 Tax=Hebeloma cylindrosporum TaxID=76867 RepID=A0A0C3C1G3_HEBCY|nr:hypothetical protein M413DRAFT_30750 [Hebeloma cylindrosporum h7]
MSIIFYDIPSTLPGIAWTPNTWKIRYCLNYKGIPYKTEWVEYPDIEEHCKKHGIAPTSKWRDGSPRYTFPAIHDPSTGIYVAESLLIARYLENQYPDTPKVFPGPHDLSALHAAFSKALDVEIAPATQFIISAIFPVLNPRSEAHFRRTREKTFGKKLEDIAPQGEDRIAQWAQFRAGLGNVNKWFEMNGGGPFLMCDVLSWSDLVLAGETIWYRILWGEDSEEWKDIKSWDGGRWGKILETLKEYETVM